LNKEKVNELKREGITPVWNSEWRWPVESGDKIKKEKRNNKE